MNRIEVVIVVMFYFSGQEVIPKNLKIKNGKICPLAYFTSRDVGQAKNKVFRYTLACEIPYTADYMNLSAGPKGE